MFYCFKQIQFLRIALGFPFKFQVGRGWKTLPRNLFASKFKLQKFQEKKNYFQKYNLLQNNISQFVGVAL